MRRWLFWEVMATRMGGQNVARSPSSTARLITAAIVSRVCAKIDGLMRLTCSLARVVHTCMYRYVEHHHQDMLARRPQQPIHGSAQEDTLL